MVSTNNPWHLLRERLMQIEETMIPSAPFAKDERANEKHHWIEFDLDVFMGERMNKRIDCRIEVKEFNRSIIITNISNQYDGLLHLFDIILSLNNINFMNIKQHTAQCIINTQHGKQIKLRIRRLQPTTLENIELNIQKENFFESAKIGCVIDGGLGKIRHSDPGIFIVGIQANSRAAKNGRLRIGDRLIQMSNHYTTINLQCIELNYALKLIERMRKESTSITLIVAHRG